MSVACTTWWNSLGGSAVALAPERGPGVTARPESAETELIARCLQGDSPAWQQLVQRHLGRVYNLCLRFTGRPEEAEDLTQEVFLRVFRNLGQYRAEAGNFGTWLTTLTRNLLVDHYRRSRNWRRTESLDSGGPEEGEPLPLADSAPGPDSRILNRERQERIQAALLRLSPELREVIILRDLQELEYKEIAAVLHLPEGTVKSRINRGRIELARRLRPSLGAEPQGAHS